MSVADYDADYEIFDTSNLPPIITREEWGALPPFGGKQVKVTHPVKNIAFSYNTEVERCETKEECLQRMKELQRFHMEKLGFNDIAYNFVIGNDGNIYEGLGWNLAPQKEFNMIEYYKNKMDIGFCGTNGKSDDMPPRPMSLAYKMMRYGQENGYIRWDYHLYGLTTKALMTRDELDERNKTSPEVAGF